MIEAFINLFVAFYSVVHESSYLPFLLLDTKPSIGNKKEEDGSKHRPRGRRMFGKHGQEEEVAAVREVSMFLSGAD